jgi:hypothetical protein
MIDMSRLDEGLARHAPVMEAVSSQAFLFFDQERLGSKLADSGRNRETRSSSPNDSNVIVKSGHEAPPFYSSQP